MRIWFPFIQCFVCGVSPHMTWSLGLSCVHQLQVNSCNSSCSSASSHHQDASGGTCTLQIQLWPNYHSGIIHNTPFCQTFPNQNSTHKIFKQIMVLKMVKPLIFMYQSMLFFWHGILVISGIFHTYLNNALHMIVFFEVAYFEIPCIAIVDG